MACANMEGTEGNLDPLHLCVRVRACANRYILPSIPSIPSKERLVKGFKIMKCLRFVSVQGVRACLPIVENAGFRGFGRWKGEDMGERAKDWLIGSVAVAALFAVGVGGLQLWGVV